MILCRNARCDVGWYHHKCVGLEEDSHQGSDWICESCHGIPFEDRDILCDSDRDIAQSIIDESDDRVQRTRSIAKVWEKHKWPKPSKVLNLFKLIASNIQVEDEFKEQLPLSIDMDSSDLPSGCWLVAKDHPEQMIEISRYPGEYEISNEVDIADTLGAMSISRTSTWDSIYQSASE